MENNFEFKRRTISENQYNKMLKEYIMDPYKNMQESTVESIQNKKKESNDLKKWIEKDNIEILNILGKK